MYLVPLAVFWISKGRHYYVAPAYPMLLAMGAVLAERWLRTLPRWGRLTAASLYFAGFIFISVFVCCSCFFARDQSAYSSNTLSSTATICAKRSAGTILSAPWRSDSRFSLSARSAGASRHHHRQLRRVRRHRRPRSRLRTPRADWHHQLRMVSRLSNALAHHALLRHREPTREQADSIFTGCRWAGHNGNSEGVKNEENVDHPDIFVCGPTRLPLPELWNEHRDFG